MQVWRPRRPPPLLWLLKSPGPVLSGGSVEARAPGELPPDRRIPEEDLVPVGRRKTSDEEGADRPDDPPSKDQDKPPRFSRRAHLLMLALAAELLLVGGIHAAGRWGKTRGIVVPVTESHKTIIT